VSATIRDAASVILARPRSGTEETEFFMLRRHRKSGFMASSYVFPGGVAEEDDAGDHRKTAARELFEEAGVLLSPSPAAPELASRLRQAVAEPSSNFDRILEEAGIGLDLSSLHYFAHWITPSIEKRRYSARFYLAELPPGQTPSFDAVETVDETWVTAAEALERSAELKLPPPQVRTFAEISAAKAGSVAELVELCRQRAQHPFAILPRFSPLDKGFALLLPWDPDYDGRGTGDGKAMPSDHPLATGPSRFVFQNEEWKNVDP
jgi:8-oxo-dGTP pyrophosphatase MutT (NUDIX family)